MATQTQTPAGPQQDHAVEEKIRQFRELFADAPELGKKALENALQVLKSQASDPPPPVESAGRVGARLGKVSELTIIVPLAPGGAKRLRAFLKLLRGNLSQGTEWIGSPTRARTWDLRINSPSLYRLSYRGMLDTKRKMIVPGSSAVNRY
jgi:hypothetical protein